MTQQPWSIAFTGFGSTAPIEIVNIGRDLNAKWNRQATEEQRNDPYRIQFLDPLIEGNSLTRVDICFLYNPTPNLLSDFELLKPNLARNSGIRVIVEPSVPAKRTNDTFEDRYTVTSLGRIVDDVAKVIKEVTYRLKLKSLLDHWSQYIQLQPPSKKFTPSSDLILQKLGIPITLVEHTVSIADNGRPASLESLIKPTIIPFEFAKVLEQHLKSLDQNIQGSYIYTLPVSALTAETETNLHATWLKIIRSNPDLRVVLVITEGDKTSQEEIMRKGCEQLNLLYPFRGHITGGGVGTAVQQKEKEMFLGDLKECLNKLGVTSDNLYDSLRG